LGFSETAFLVLLGLLLFGPKKLPEIGRQIGRLMAEFRRASAEFQNQLTDEVRQLEREVDATKQILPPMNITARIESFLESTINGGDPARNDGNPARHPAPEPVVEVRSPAVEVRSEEPAGNPKPLSDAVTQGPNV
jgi:sec-independent protein translocase protein TatB